MAEIDDLTHLSSMLDDFSEGELIEDDIISLLPPSPEKKEFELKKDKVEGSQTPSFSNVKLYVGRLSPNVTETLLISIFSEFGVIHWCRVIYSETVKPFAFISFYEPKDANSARLAMDGKSCLGERMKVRWAVENSNKVKAKLNGVTEEQHRVFVGNLDKDANTEDVRQAFAPFGELVLCKILYEHDTSISRGFAFVAYTNASDAEMAITTMQGQWIKGRPIRTGWAYKNLNADASSENVKVLSTSEHDKSTENWNRIYNQTSMMNRTVFVGGLCPSVASGDVLKLAFERFGRIEDLRLCGPSSLNNSVFAFITFVTKESACNAIVCMHNKIIDGKPLKCSWGRERFTGEETNFHGDNQSFIPPSDFGQPIINIQRTIPGYAADLQYFTPPIQPGPPLQSHPPLQPHPSLESHPPPAVPEQPPYFPSESPPVPLPKPTTAPPNEDGFHAFSYYGTYVYQEKEDSDENPLKDSDSSDINEQPPPSTHFSERKLTSPIGRKSRSVSRPKLVLRSKSRSIPRKKVASKSKPSSQSKLASKSKSRSKSFSRSKSRSKSISCSSSSSESRSRSKSRSISRSKSVSRSRVKYRIRSQSRYRSSSRSRSRSVSVSFKRPRYRRRRHDSRSLSPPRETLSRRVFFGNHSNMPMSSNSGMSMPLANQAYPQPINNGHISPIAYPSPPIQHQHPQYPFVPNFPGGAPMQHIYPRPPQPYVHMENNMQGEYNYQNPNYVYNWHPNHNQQAFYNYQPNFNNQSFPLNNVPNMNSNPGYNFQHHPFSSNHYNSHCQPGFAPRFRNRTYRPK